MLTRRVLPADRAALLKQLLQLTPEQLEALPPAEKAQAQAIINMMKGAR